MSSGLRTKPLRRPMLAATVVLAGLAGASSGATFIYTTVLDGPSESPTNTSPGVGFATVTADTTAHTLHVNVSFTGLVGTTTISHIHAATAVAFTGTANVATTTPSFAGFPAGVTSGIYDNTLDTTLSSSYNPAYITANGGTTAGAEAALFASLATGRAYFNIHTSAFPGGEIRGFIPGPGAAAVIGLGGLLAGRRRR